MKRARRTDVPRECRTGARLRGVGVRDVALRRERRAAEVAAREPRATDNDKCVTASERTPFCDSPSTL